MESEQLQVGVAASTQAAMIEPELVRQIRALEAMRWGSKRIARELGLALMTVKRYRRGGAEAEAQHRPTRRALDDEQRAKARELVDRTAEGNAVVVTHLLAEEGIDVDSPPPRAAASAIRWRRPVGHARSSRWAIPQRRYTASSLSTWRGRPLWDPLRLGFRTLQRLLSADARR